MYVNMRQCDSKIVAQCKEDVFLEGFAVQHSEAIIARPNMQSRRFGIKICFRANFGQLTGQLTLKLSVI